MSDVILGHNPHGDNVHFFVGIMTFFSAGHNPHFPQRMPFVHVWPLHRKTFLSEAESGTYWRRKPLSPAEGGYAEKLCSANPTTYSSMTFTPKTFLSEAESGSYWRRKPLRPAEGRLLKKTFKSKTTNIIMDDFYTEKIHGLYDISFVDIMPH